MPGEFLEKGYRWLDLWDELCTGRARALPSFHELKSGSYFMLYRTGSGRLNELRGIF
jgi:hypothetical protein